MTSKVVVCDSRSEPYAQSMVLSSLQLFLFLPKNSCKAIGVTLITCITGASVVGKTDTVKTQRKGGLGGKKSLGDLSNSGKPAFNQVSKKQHSKNFAPELLFVGKGDVLKTPMRACEGNQLGDISNSGKLVLSPGSKSSLQI
ncbi:unnamed protein product [Prunus armeniaca]|uniref:Uncharacterized protein n=1 Tax=Prunus armeniaca TaxID=36596 RepID=A0A6J5XSD6_PRUAR|nr:unnamed protein product [Prunus armeniaca]